MIRAEYRVVDNGLYPGEWYVEFRLLTTEHAGFETSTSGPHTFHMYPEHPDELRAVGEAIIRAADELQAKQVKLASSDNHPESGVQS